VYCTYLGGILIRLEEELFIIMGRLVEFSRAVRVAIHARNNLVRVDDDFPLLRLVDLLCACHCDRGSKLKRVVEELDVGGVGVRKN